MIPMSRATFLVAAFAFACFPTVPSQALPPKTALDTQPAPGIPHLGLALCATTQSFVAAARGHQQLSGQSEPCSVILPLQIFTSEEALQSAWVSPGCYAVAALLELSGAEHSEIWAISQIESARLIWGTSDRDGRLIWGTSAGGDLNPSLEAPCLEVFVVFGCC